MSSLKHVAELIKKNKITEATDDKDDYNLPREIGFDLECAIT